MASLSLPLLASALLVGSFASAQGTAPTVTLSDSSSVSIPGYFGRSAMAYDPTRNRYLVTWVGFLTASSEYEVLGRLVDASTGSPAGPVLRISDMGPAGDSSYEVRRPDVVFNPIQDEFLVVWSGEDDVPSQHNFEVHCQRIDAATGAEIGINDFPISVTGAPGAWNYYARAPRVVHNSIRNEYFVVWHGGYTLSVNNYSVRGQRLDGSTGAEIGADDFLISDTSWASESTLVYRPIGNEYYVAWKFRSPVSLDGIWGRRLDADTGNLLGPSTQIANTGSSTGIYSVRAAYNLPADEYLVVWSDYEDIQPGAREIRAQRVDAATGLEVGADDYEITSMGPPGDPEFDAELPEVVYCSPRDEYVVVWSGDDDQNGLVEGEFEIFVQRLDGATGAEIGIDDVRLTHMGPDGDPTFDADSASIAYSFVSGNFLLAWVGNDSPSDPGSTYAALVDWGDASATVYGCGVNPAGSLSILSGTPTIGSTVVIGVDNPLGTQASGSLPGLLVSLRADPAFPCGTVTSQYAMAGPGSSAELLIDLSPPYLIPGAILGPPWIAPGLPAPIQVTIPNNIHLIGLSLYFQGVILDTNAGAMVPIGAADAAKLVIGA